MTSAAADIDISRCKQADKHKVGILLLSTYQSTWLPNMSATARAALDPQLVIDDYLEQCYAEFVVARIGHMIAGMVHWRDNFLEALHVHPQHQRRGIGSMLLARAEADIRRRGIELLLLETQTFNKPARAFYATHGYEELDAYPDPEWQSDFKAILLGKRLIMPAQQPIDRRARHSS